MTPCILIPISVGIISALLGYLLGKMITGGNNLNLHSKLDAALTENEQLNNRNYLLERELAAISTPPNTLQDELNACMARSAKLEEEIASLKPKPTASEFVSSDPIIFDTELAKTVFGERIIENDLKIIEGIGPKIEELYHAAGIKTWKDMAETPVQALQNILNEGGSRYAMHNPETWSKQAAMAYLGKWQELKDYQESLNAGRE